MEFQEIFLKLVRKISKKKTEDIDYLLLQLLLWYGTIIIPRLTF